MRRQPAARRRSYTFTSAPSGRTATSSCRRSSTARSVDAEIDARERLQAQAHEGLLVSSYSTTNVEGEPQRAFSSMPQTSRHDDGIGRRGAGAGTGPSWDDDGPSRARTTKPRRSAVSEGAPARNRTWNLRIKSPLLCQLSYKGAGAKDSADAGSSRRSGVGVGCGLLDLLERGLGLGLLELVLEVLLLVLGREVDGLAGGEVALAELAGLVGEEGQVLEGLLGRVDLGQHLLRRRRPCRAG